MGPAGLGAVIGILFLNAYGKAIPRRLLIDIGLVAMGITLIGLALVKPVTSALGPTIGTIENSLPEALAPLTSLIALVVVIAVSAGIEYAFVAIPSQTALQEELPADVRGRIFGILNTLLSVGAFLPVILAPAAADVINIFVPGAGIPIAMAILGALTLWAGIASWRRNSKAGLHQHDRTVAPPADAVDERTAPGVPDAPDEIDEVRSADTPHRHRRRRRRPVDGN
jgi:MFS family permease